jgi:hypothetical protein
LLFHELAESFEKIDAGVKTYEQGHRLAVRGGTAFSECRGRDSSETKKMT